MNYKIGAIITYIGKKYNNLLYLNQNYEISSNTITTDGIKLQLKGFEEYFLADQFTGAPLILNIDEIRKKFLQKYEYGQKVHDKEAENKKDFPDDQPPIFTDFATTTFKKTKKKM